MSVYVVDTGTREVYALAGDEAEAAEKVVGLTGEPINYVEFFSDDVADAPDHVPLLR